MRELRLFLPCHPILPNVNSHHLTHSVPDRHPGMAESLSCLGGCGSIYLFRSSWPHFAHLGVTGAAPVFLHLSPCTPQGCSDAVSATWSSGVTRTCSGLAPEPLWLIRAETQGSSIPPEEAAPSSKASPVPHSDLLPQTRAVCPGFRSPGEPCPLTRSVLAARGLPSRVQQVVADGVQDGQVPLPGNHL